MLYEQTKTVGCPCSSSLDIWERKDISPLGVKVKVGTTGYQGGDSGHGGRTYLKLSGWNNEAGDIEIDRISDGLEIKLGGDWELEALLESLRFSVMVLEEEIKSNSIK